MATKIEVLIVEDRQEDAELMEVELRRGGYEVNSRRVDNEKDFLAALEKPVDLILSDWSLPQFSGAMALDLLIECGQDIPFILVSGSIGEDAAVELTHKGAFDYILKDRLGRLGSAVERALEDRRLREEKFKADQALRASELRYRLISENAGDVIWVMDPETFRFEYVSPSVEKLRGYTPAEVMDQPVSEALTPESLKKVKSLLVSWRSGTLIPAGADRYISEIEQPCKNGSIVSTEVTTSVMHNENGKVKIIGVTRDITLRKRLEKANVILSEAERQIVTMNSIPEIFKLVGSKAKELIGSGYVGVTSLDETAQAMRVIGLYGVGSLYDNLVQKFKIDPAKSLYYLKDMSAQDLGKFRSGKLEEYEDGLYGLLLRKAPKKICQVIEKELKIDRIYTMGFAWQDFHFGGITILAQEDIAPYKGFIETMVNQASITIKRIRSEEALKASEEKFRGVIEQSSDGIVIVDEDGIIVEWNNRQEGIVGYAKDEFLGKPLWEAQYAAALPELQTPELLNKIKTRIQMILTTRSSDSFGRIHEVQLRRKDGAVRNVESVVYPIYVGGKFLIGSVTRDITQRKEIEEALRESEARFRIVFENANDAIFIENEDDEILFANPRACAMMGYSAEQFSRMHVGEMQAPEVRQPGNILKEELKNHGSSVFEGVNLHASGRRIPVEISVARIERPTRNIYISIVRDISERKKAEKVLKETERIYRQAITQAGSVPYQRDYQSGKYGFLGEGFQSITGFSPEEMDAGSFINRIRKFDPHGEYKEPSQEERDALALWAKLQEWQEDYVFERKDGSLIWLSDHSVPIQDEKGKVAGSLGILTDISERKKAEEELTRRNEELARLYRASGSLISGISLTLQEQARQIVEALQKEFRQDNSSLFLLEEETGELIRLAVAGPYSDQVRNARLNLQGKGLVVRAMRQGKPINTPDVGTEEDYLPRWDLARSEMTIPLKIGNNVVGAIDVQSPLLNAFSADDERLLTIFAERATLALERSRLNMQMEVRIRQLTALRNIDIAISGSFELSLTLGIVLDQVISQLRIAATDVLLFNPSTQTLKLSCDRGFHSVPSQNFLQNFRAGYAWRAIRERRPISISAGGETGANERFLPEFSGEEFEAYMGIPLIAKGQVRGVLELFQRGPMQMEPEWANFLEMLAGQAAIAIDNSELFESLQRSNSELSLAYDNTLEGWANALELRDQETAGHTRRATELTVRLAQTMNVNENQIVHIYRGALLHDIGKMGVPDSIIRKPGPLTDEEWVIMRKHPQYANDLLSPIAFLRPALNIPYCHHERWDGSGYPRGLKGEQIPLEARIFAVIDVWDALTSDRSYRPAWTEARALQYILDQSGKHFDPNVVTIFLKEMGHE